MNTLQVIPFQRSLKESGLSLPRIATEILQVNLGKICNQACRHCHVEAGPKRTEIMTKETVDRILSFLREAPEIHTVDLTGGAPELNPHFRYIVSEVRAMGKKVIDRCNLTVLFEPGQEETADFLCQHQVEITASLPCYQKDNVDRQRGRGVFDKSIEGLKLLNRLGYGKEGTDLVLNLVYNPQGINLPPGQKALEEAYKKELKELFEIEFNHLYTITNMPIKRFLNDLEKSGQLAEYMCLLQNNFNPQAAENVMCRNQISVGWDGQLYDCDFNQMLEIPFGWQKTDVWDIHSLKELESKKIAFADHCYGCTAGAGSSCGGALSE